MMSHFTFDNRRNKTSGTNINIYNINLGTVEKRCPSRSWEKAIGTVSLVALMLLLVICAFSSDSSVCAAVSSVLHFLVSNL